MVRELDGADRLYATIFKEQSAKIRMTTDDAPYKLCYYFRRNNNIMSKEAMIDLAADSLTAVCSYWRGKCCEYSNQPRLQKHAYRWR